MSSVAARAGTPVGRPRAAALPWSPAAARLVAFAALAAFATAHWATLVEDPPSGRLALVVLLATAGGALLARLRTLPLGRARRVALAAAVALAMLLLALVITGLPVRLLWPGNWTELGDGLDRGLAGIPGVQWPYGGEEGWIRLSVLLGAPLVVALASAAAFWPGRRERTTGGPLGLVLLLVLYGTAVTEHDPGEPLLRGLLLLLLLGAWLWLPRLGSREAVPAAVLLAAVAVLAMPAAAKLNADGAWWDYRAWSWFGDGKAVSFDWDHSYGPMDWPRDGTTLLNVKSDRPLYWKTETLDRFDGLRWRRVRDGRAVSSAGELPDRLRPEGATWDYFEFNPRWDERVRFTIRSLTSDFIVGAGTTYEVRGAGPTASVRGGSAITLSEPLEKGDSYSVSAYVPNPSGAQMRGAPQGYTSDMAEYTEVALPGPGDSALRPPERDDALHQDEDSVSVPLWSSGSQFAASEAERRLLASPYGDVQRLTRRVTADAPTVYDAAKRIETYLERNHTYSEQPPSFRYPLAAFLTKDKTGYCQQFSGSMALMLRMSGIPARVASGFSAGSYNRDSREYRVRDLDAHSWVEVYFTGIGWVQFDPTPAAAPAELQLGSDASADDRGDAGAASTDRGEDSPLSDRAEASPAAGGSPEAGPPVWLPVGGLALLALLGALLVHRVRRRRRADPRELAHAQLSELTSALRRLGWQLPGSTTLLALERRLGRAAGPAAASYAARLRAHRYDPDPPTLPGTADRRALRRELAGRGLRGRWRALAALPPWGPREV